MTHVSNNTGNNEWYTQQVHIDAARQVMGCIDTDPASNDIAQQRVQASVYYTKENSGLDRLWAGNVWMNPPYSSKLIGLFCDHLVDCTNLGLVTQFITLTNNATETRWFHSLMTVSNAICLVQGRIRFLSPEGALVNTPLQGQCFTYYGDNVKSFRDVFGQFGKVVTC